MEQTTRKHSERDAAAEQVEDIPETEVDREARLAELDEILDDIDKVLEDNVDEVEESRTVAAMAGADAERNDASAMLARIGLFGPDDLDEDILQRMLAYTEELAELERDELQAEVAEFYKETNPPCAYCGACPVLPGCPFQADGDLWYRDFDGTFVHDN